MTIFFVFYFIILTLTLIYVGVNIYHIVRFRLDVPGDKSFVALTLYILAVIGILIGSVIMAIIASQA